MPAFMWKHVDKWSILYSNDKLLMRMPTTYIGRIYGELWIGSHVSFVVQNYTFVVIVSIDQVQISHNQIRTTLGTVSDTLELFAGVCDEVGLDSTVTIWWNDCRVYGAGFSLDCCGGTAEYLFPYYSTGISVEPGVMSFSGNTHFKSIRMTRRRESLIELMVDNDSQFITPYALEHILVKYRLDLVRHSQPAYSLDQIYVFMGGPGVKL